MEETFVFIGTYTSGDSESEGIYIYRFDPIAGSLTQVGHAGGIENPSFLEVSANGRFLYAVSEVFEVEGSPGGALRAYALDPEGGALHLLNEQSTHGACPCHISLDSSGRHARVSNYMGGSIAVLPVNEEGFLEEASQVVQHEGCSRVNPERQEAPHAHSVILAADKRFAIAADLGMDALCIYALESETGQMLPGTPDRVSMPPGAGPRHMDFHPGGHFLYVLNELASTIRAYHYDARNGGLSFINEVSTLPQGYEGENIAAHIQVHPNGRFLYASNRGFDSIVACQVNEKTGELSVLGHHASMGMHPRHFSLDPTGSCLLVANKNSNSIASIEINRSTGELQPFGELISVPRPVCVAFSRTNIKF